MKRAFCCLLLMVAATLAFAQPMWPNEVVVRDGQDLHYYGDPVPDAFGNTLATWVKSTQGKHYIYADLMQPSGLSLWDNPVIVQESSQPLQDIQVHLSSDNCFVLGWLESGSHQGTKIMLQKLTASGMTLWGEGVLVLDERIQTYYQIETAANSQGGAYVFYKQENGNVIKGRNFDSAGNETWGANAPLINGAESTSFSGIASREGYGVAIHYRSGENSTNFVTRYAEAGYPEWQQSYPYVAGEETRKHELFVTNDYKLVDAIVLAEPAVKLQARLFSSQGTPLLNPAFEQILDDTPMGSLCYDVDCDGLALYLLYTTNTGTNTEIRYLFIPGGFNAAYPAGGLLMGGAEGIDIHDLKLNVTDIGKVYCGWLVGSEASATLKLNSVNSEMQAAWGQGISYNSVGQEILGYGMQGNADGMKVLVHHQETASQRLHMQVFNAQGTPQAGSDGYLLASAARGSANPLATHTIGDRVLVLYYDQDISGTNSLWYQLVSSGGYPVLPQPLRLGQENTPVQYCKSCNWNGTVAVIYKQGINYYLQVIGYGGELNMGAPGIYITNQVDSGFKMTEFAMDLYLGWMRNSSPGYKQVVGQCFRNWQWAWGTDGKVLVDNIPATDYALGESDGCYYTWLGKGPGDTYSKVYCLLVNTNGDPYPGWNPQGELVFDNAQDTDQKPIWAKLQGNSLIMLLGGLAPSSLYAVRVNIDHTLPWGASPLQIADNSVVYLDCLATANGFATILGMNAAGQAGVALQFVSADGTLQYTYPGYMLQNFSASSGAPIVRLAAYANGRYLALWNMNASTELRELYYQTLSPLGTPLETTPQLVSQLAGHKQAPRVSVLGNQAIVSFMASSNDLPPDYHSPFMGIFAQKLNGDFLSVPDEPEVPLANLRIKSCYPNPFSGSATLVWEQKAAGTVQVSIYNLKGQLVKEYGQSAKSSGEHSLAWNGQDDLGRKVASGIYFVRLSNGKETQTRKLVKM